MAQLLPFIDTRPQFEIGNPPAPPNPPVSPLPLKSINTASKTALVVADQSLVKFLKRCLEEDGYAVRIASNTIEGMRLYRDLSPFNVVIIDFDVPQRNEVVFDYRLPQTSGKELASHVLKIDPSQGIILAATAYRNLDELSLPQDLMHIPILVGDISICQLRTLLSTLEVRRAIAGLTVADKLRLKRSAACWVQARGLPANYRTADDLLSEAQFLTLIGAKNPQRGRHWNRNVDLVWYLKEAMRSISSNWKRQWEKETQMLELPRYDFEGNEQSPLENVASCELRADLSLIRKEQVLRIFRMFPDDTEATHVLQGWYDDLKPNEIRQKYGLDVQRFASAAKRIRTKLLGRKTQ